MRDKPLVSILTPCYNGGAYVDRFFETVMAQTYPNIELIFVDDGSTDDTFDKAGAWRGRLEERGIAFKLLTHPNGGQASAINLGLPDVTGDYVTWPDSDDIMDSRNIEKKVEYLEAHPEKGLVVCDVIQVAESDLDTVIHRSVFDDSTPRIFDGLIREKAGYYCSDNAYLVRSDALFSVIGGRRIYESRSGQNWQLLFPLTYHYDCGFIHQDLVTYVVRDDSHSRSYVSLNDQLQRTYELEDIIEHVLPTMGMNGKDFEHYMRFAKVKYLHQRFNIAIKMGDRVLARKFKGELDAAHGPSFKRELLTLICVAGLGPVSHSVAHAVKDMVRAVHRGTIGK